MAISILATLAACLTAVRAALNESTAGFWTDTEIENWIKEAVLNVSSIAKCYETSSDITLATDTLEYTEPTDILIVDAAMYKDAATPEATRALTPTSPSQIATLNVVTPGPPQFYYHHHAKIGIWPLPTVAFNSKSVSIIGALKTDDITKLPPEFRPPVVDYAVAMALFKDEKHSAAQGAFQRFSMTLSSLVPELYDSKWQQSVKKQFEYGDED